MGGLSRTSVSISASASVRSTTRSSASWVVGRRSPEVLAVDSGFFNRQLPRGPPVPILVDATAAEPPSRKGPELGLGLTRSVWDSGADGNPYRPRVVQPTWVALESATRTCRCMADEGRDRSRTTLDARSTERPWMRGSMVEAPRACSFMAQRRIVGLASRNRRSDASRRHRYRTRWPAHGRIARHHRTRCGWRRQRRREDQRSPAGNLSVLRAGPPGSHRANREDRTPDIRGRAGGGVEGCGPGLHLRRYACSSLG